MARKGNGYVALTATGGVELVTSGDTAQREVRAAAAVDLAGADGAGGAQMAPLRNLSKRCWRSR